MERNLSNRIEVCFPILKKKLANRIINEMGIYLDDRTQSWELQSDGDYISYQPDNEKALAGVQALLLNKLA